MVTISCHHQAASAMRYRWLYLTFMGLLALGLSTDVGAKIVDAVVHKALVLCVNEDGTVSAWWTRQRVADAKFSRALSSRPISHIASDGSTLWGLSGSSLLKWSHAEWEWSEQLSLKLEPDKPIALLSLGHEPVIVYPSKVVRPITAQTYPVPKLKAHHFGGIWPRVRYVAAPNIWFATHYGEWGGHLLRLDTETGEWSSYYDPLHYVEGIAQVSQNELIVTWSMDHLMETTLVRLHDLNTDVKREFPELSSRYFQSVAYEASQKRIYAVEYNQVVELRQGIPHFVADLRVPPRGGVLALFTLPDSSLLIVNRIYPLMILRNGEQYLFPPARKPEAQEKNRVQEAQSARRGSSRKSLRQQTRNSKSAWVGSTVYGSPLTQGTLDNHIAAHNNWLETIENKCIKDPTMETYRACLRELRDSNLGSDAGRFVLRGAKLNGANLRRAKLSIANLQVARLNKANLEEAELNWANLGWVDLNRAKLQRAKLRDSNLEMAILNKANLKDAELNWANLKEAQLNWANLEGADLSLAILRRAKLHGAKLERASLQGANLKVATLQEAELMGANLRGANLQGANLQKANLQAADLADVDLSKAKAQKANLLWANLRGANLREAKLEEVELQGTVLKGADLSETNLQKADMLWANLQGANLKGAKLNKANLQGANLDKANLQGADLEEADLSEAKLRRANLLGANLLGANLRRANLHGANLRGVNLHEADLGEANLIGVIYEPKPDTLPNISSLLSAVGLETMRYKNDPHGLQSLRKAFKDNNHTRKERLVTYAIRRSEWEKATREGRWIEAWFNELLFDWPFAYGLYPGRLIKTLIGLTGFLLFLYMVTPKKKETLPSHEKYAHITSLIRR